MGWLFSCTGNSSIDYNDDAMCECQPLSWDKDDLDFALEIIRDKAKQKQFFLDEGLPATEHHLFDNIADIHSALQSKTISYPFVQKLRSGG